MDRAARSRLARAGRTAGLTRSPSLPSLPPCLESLHRRAARPILLRLPARVFEDGLGVGLHEIAGLDPLEAVTLEKPCVLCLQQSSGNSAGPEVDLSSSFL